MLHYPNAPTPHCDFVVLSSAYHSAMLIMDDTQRFLTEKCRVRARLCVIIAMGYM